MSSDSDKLRAALIPKIKKMYDAIESLEVDELGITSEILDIPDVYTPTNAENALLKDLTLRTHLYDARIVYELMLDLITKGQWRTNEGSS